MDGWMERMMDGDSETVDERCWGFCMLEDIFFNEYKGFVVSRCFLTSRKIKTPTINKAE